MENKSLAMLLGKAISVILILIGRAITSESQVLYDHPSTLDPTIYSIPESGGFYLYDVYFQNTDNSPIWDFEVFTCSSTIAVGALPFDYLYDQSLDYVDPQYDARNLDPSLTDMVRMWNGNTGVGGLAVGDYGSISFYLYGYYSSFIYAYETDASGWANVNGGYQAAVGGITVPEPSLISLFVVFGGILLHRRRFQAGAVTANTTLEPISTGIRFRIK